MTFNDDFVKDIWHALSYACLKLGKGRSALPRILAGLQRALRDGERLAEVRGIRTARHPFVLESETAAIVSQGLVVETITEAQIALAAGNLQRFVNQLDRGIAMVQAMEKRGAA